MNLTRSWFALFFYRLYLAFEFTVLFLLLPILYIFGYLPVHKMVILAGAALFTFSIMYMEGRLNRRFLFYFPVDARIAGRLFFRILLVSSVIVLFTALATPDKYLIFPSENPGGFILVLFMYPVISALPQEFIYRFFLWQRYREIFTSERMLKLASIFSFTWVHITYNNWVAILFSFIGALFFVSTFAKTRSLLWVSIEHSIYGNLMFTVGMGEYFYRTGSDFWSLAL